METSVALDFLGDLRRTHMCGDLRAAHAGQKVLLMGWAHKRRDHGAIKNIELGGPRKCNAGDARFHENTDRVAHVFVPSRTSPIGSGRNSAGSITRGGRGTSSGKFA